MKVRLVEHDWKKHLDVLWLQEALFSVFNGKSIPQIKNLESIKNESYIRKVPNPEGDLFVYVVSNKIIDDEKAQKIWDSYSPAKNCNEDPRYSPVEYPFIYERD